MWSKSRASLVRTVIGIAVLVISLLLLASCSERTVSKVAKRPRSKTSKAEIYGPPVPTSVQSAIPYVKTKVARKETNSKTAGFLYIPKGKKGPFPAVIAIHCGPADALEVGYSGSQPTGDNFARRLTPLGYAVFAVDYRWSPIGAGELDDIAGAYDYLRKRKEIDFKRIVLAGEGHGGYMALMSVVSEEYSRPYTAAVNLSGFVDLAEYAGRETTDPQVKLTVSKLPDASIMRVISPISRIDKVSVPVLIVVGTSDTPGLLAELRTYREEMNKAGKSLEYLEVPDAPHRFSDNAEPYTRKLWETVTAFLDKQLKDGLEDDI